MFIKFKRKKNKKITYFLNNIKQVIKIQSQVRGFFIRKNLNIMSQVKRILQDKKVKKVVIIQK